MTKWRQQVLRSPDEPGEPRDESIVKGAMNTTVKLLIATTAAAVISSFGVVGLPASAAAAPPDMLRIWVCC